MIFHSLDTNGSFFDSRHYTPAGLTKKYMRSAPLIDFMILPHSRILLPVPIRFGRMTEAAPNQVNAIFTAAWTTPTSRNA